MSTQHVPSNVVAGRGSPFPQGVFMGTLAEVTTRWSDDQKNMDMTLQLAENTPFDEDSPQVGARTKRQRVTLIYDGQALVDVEEFNDDTPIALQRSSTLVTQLAMALGQATLNEDKSVDIDTEAFLNQLTNNVFKGEVVVFEVRHRKWTSKDKKTSGLADDIVSFKSPMADEPVDSEPVAAEAEVATPAAALTGTRKRS